MRRILLALAIALSFSAVGCSSLQTQSDPSNNSDPHKNHNHEPGGRR